MFGNICCSKVIETPLNPSTHCPVILRFSIAYKSMINESQSATDRTSHKVDAESIGCYKARIDVLIDNLNISLAKMSCTDVLCDSTAYRSDIDSLCKQLIDVLIRAGHETLPLCKSDHEQHSVPGWGAEVEEVRDVAMFWHWLWIDNGRPRQGQVAKVMRMTRAGYHYAVRSTA